MNHNNKIIANIIIFIICLLIAIGLLSITSNSNKKIIDKEIQSKGGIVENIDYRSFYTGPFHWIQKSERVYKITYKDKNNQIQEAWVDFGWSEKWIWDYKEK